MVSGRGERVMCFMEGQGVDGHVGDESSPYRNTFVSVFEYVSLFSLLFSLFLFSSPLSCLVLSCLVLWCVVVSCGVVCVCVCVLACVCVCWRAAHSPQFPSKLLRLNSFVRYSD